AIKQEAKQRGFAKLTLAATPNASVFYEKNGFILIGESFYPSQLAQANLRCMDMVCYL
ncbi:GNAT family N-acetyltransferase, partial [Escherichia coli]